MSASYLTKAFLIEIVATFAFTSVAFTSTNPIAVGAALAGALFMAQGLNGGSLGNDLNPAIAIAQMISSDGSRSLELFGLVVCSIIGAVAAFSFKSFWDVTN